MPRALQHIQHTGHIHLLSRQQCSAHWQVVCDNCKASRLDALMCHLIQVNHHNKHSSTCTKQTRSNCTDRQQASRHRKLITLQVQKFCGQNAVTPSMRLINVNPNQILVYTPDAKIRTRGGTAGLTRLVCILGLVAQVSDLLSVTHTLSVSVRSDSSMNNSCSSVTG